MEAALRRAGFQPSWKTSADEALALLEQRGLRRRRHRSAHEGHERPRAVRAHRGQPARRAGGGGHRLRQPRDGGRAPSAPAPTTSSPSRSTRGARARRSSAPCSTARLRDEVKRLRQAVARARGLRARCVGESPAMRKVYDLIDRVADTDATRAHHRRERHRQGAGRARAAPAQPARERPVRRRQLRGHARGAARERAVRPRQGRLHRRASARARASSCRPTAARCSSTRSARCRSGMQPKLLRALQERDGAPGRRRPRGCPFDARIVAATNRDLEQRCRGEALPRGPLLPHQRRPHRAAAAARARQRRAAAGAALRRAVRRSSAASASSASRRRPWPRSCSPTTGRATCASWRTASSARSRSRASSEITVDDLPEKIRDYRATRRSSCPATTRPSSCTLDEVERRYILRVLEAVGGNKTHAARGPRPRSQDALPQARALRRSRSMGKPAIGD